MKNKIKTKMKMKTKMNCKIVHDCNSNLQNSTVMSPFLVFDRKCPFWANLVQNVKIVGLRLNLVASLIRICRIQ